MFCVCFPPFFCSSHHCPCLFFSLSISAHLSIFLSMSNFNCFCLLNYDICHEKFSYNLLCGVKSFTEHMHYVRTVFFVCYVDFAFSVLLEYYSLFVVVAVFSCKVMWTFDNSAIRIKSNKLFNNVTTMHLYIWITSAKYWCSVYDN